MSKVWYGNLNNRLEENKQFCEEIQVGTGMTEYSYTDREAYEVTAVKDQKHVTVRRYDHKLIGEAYSNDWELISNPNNPEYDMVKRGNYWYSQVTITPDKLNDSIECRLWLAHNNTSIDEVNAKGKVVRYHKMNVSFGVADYYYDYEF